MKPCESVNRFYQLFCSRPTKCEINFSVHEADENPPDSCLHRSVGWFFNFADYSGTNRKGHALERCTLYQSNIIPQTASKTWGTHHCPLPALACSQTPELYKQDPRQRCNLANPFLSELSTSALWRKLHNPTFSERLWCVRLTLTESQSAMMFNKHFTEMEHRLLVYMLMRGGGISC